MLVRTIWKISVRARSVLRRWMPTNILLDYLRTRRGLRWGIPAMGLGLVYLLFAATCLTAIEHGASEWLYLVIVLGIWNGAKFLFFGPISLVLTLSARARNRSTRSASSENLALHE